MSVDNDTVDRSALARATWAKRSPSYQTSKTLTLRPDVYDALNALRGSRTWAEYLCELAGITPPPDRRRNRE